MRKRKLRQRFAAEFGTIPDPLYLTGDMEHIRAYHDARHAQEPEVFAIDDTTWNDLDMDRLFRRVNPGLSTSGEQYLYHTLRTPAQTPGELSRRTDMIALMEEEPALRTELQMILHRLGCARRADLSAAFRPAKHGRGWLVAYLLMLCALVASVFVMPLMGKPGVLLPVVCLIINGITHEFRRSACERDYATVNYSVGMARALHRMQRLRHPRLDTFLAPVYPQLDTLRTVMRIGTLTPQGGDMMSDLANTIFLTDLISYEFLKTRLGCCHREIFCIHEALGRIDTAIAAASFRRSLDTRCIPEVVFGAPDTPLTAEALRHPLTPGAVPNDVAVPASLLLTGSNASGKSTFLKAVMMNAILAQTLGVCACKSWRAPAFRPMTSMALRDDLLAGESYYIVETRSLLRILEAAAQPGQPVLAAVDEVLRGTNTIERIAASCEVLRALHRAGAHCLAATHDLELCTLLEDSFDMAHFEEQVTADELSFDYRLRPGPATSRNAIRLLALLGYDGALVDAAHARAARFAQTGSWRV
ncbi:MAG: hypothetical protein IJ343_01655 [Clostridia bacterium]|nr:hypothetical protein [Clostridia bacterium]